MRCLVAALLLLLLVACQRAKEKLLDYPHPPPASSNIASAARPANLADGGPQPRHSGSTVDAPNPPLALSPPRVDKRNNEILSTCSEGLGTYLEKAIRYYDESDPENALACASQAAAAEPRNADALAERGAALVALGRYEEARVIFGRVLAIDPDHADGLLGAADLYLSRLPFSRDNSELGLEYAIRGFKKAQRLKDRVLAGQFSLFQAIALNDLGRGKESIERARAALAAGVDNPAARFELASALWDLCRYSEAEKELVILVKEPDRAARAHYYLGLIAERKGRHGDAAKEMGLARKLAPREFPQEVTISTTDFARLVDRKLKEISPDMQRDLGGVKIVVQDIPDEEDLSASDPPLSPSIIGLFRGPPLQEQCPPPEETGGACRTIVLYRKNLARSVRDGAELDRQTQMTLLHEIGHLRGEDDVQLTARGLE